MVVIEEWLKERCELKMCRKVVSASRYADLKHARAARFDHAVRAQVVDAYAKVQEWKCMGARKRHPVLHPRV
jgi:CBS-domain-containing membrane protein